MKLIADLLTQHHQFSHYKDNRKNADKNNKNVLAATSSKTRARIGIFEINFVVFYPHTKAGENLDQNYIFKLITNQATKDIANLISYFTVFS